MGKGSAVAAAPPFFCARVVPVRVAAGAPTPGNPSSVRPAETPAPGVEDSGAGETATRRGHVGAPVADARHRGVRVLLALLGGDLAVRPPMPCLGTAGS